MFVGSILLQNKLLYVIQCTVCNLLTHLCCLLKDTAVFSAIVNICTYVITGLVILEVVA